MGMPGGVHKSGRLKKKLDAQALNDNEDGFT